MKNKYAVSGTQTGQNGMDYGNWMRWVTASTPASAMVEAVRVGEGYIYYKGQQVEHYSHRSEEEDRERRDLADLLARCVKAESLGLTINSGTVIWCWSWFAGMDNNHPYLPLMRTLPGLWVRPTEKHPHPSLPDGYYNIGDDGHELLIEKGDTFWLWDGKELKSYHPPGPDVFGSYYHNLVALGWHLANAGQNVQAGQVVVYATTEGLTAFFERMKLPHGFTLPQ